MAGYYQALTVSFKNISLSTQEHIPADFFSASEFTNFPLQRYPPGYLQKIPPQRIGCKAKPSKGKATGFPQGRMAAGGGACHAGGAGHGRPWPPPGMPRLGCHMPHRGRVEPRYAPGPSPMPQPSPSKPFTPKVCGHYLWNRKWVRISAQRCFVSPALCGWDPSCVAFYGSGMVRLSLGGPLRLTSLQKLGFCLCVFFPLMKRDKGIFF